MSSNIKLVVVAALAVLAVTALHLAQNARNQSALESMQAKLVEMNSEIEQLKRESERLLANAAQPAPDAAMAEAAPPPAPEKANPSTDDAGTLDMTEMMKNLFVATDMEGEGDIMDMAKGFMENPAFIKMMVKQEYGGLFDRLNLSPEREEELMAALMESAKKMYGGAFDDSFPDTEDTEQELREAVAKVLRPNEMAIYDDYEEHKHDYIMREHLFSELHYLSGKVSEQSLHRFVDLQLQSDRLFNENVGDDPAAFMDEFNPTDYFSLRLESFQHTLEQLTHELTPEEYEAFARHIEFQSMQAAQIEAMFERMGMDEQFQNIMQEFSPGE